MKLLLTLFFIAAAFNIYAQNEYGYIDAKALKIPVEKTYSTADIAQYIHHNFTKEGEKIRAAYTWIINNIKYSKDSLQQFNRWGINPEINMSAILRRRKGVCENYAALFTSILLKCNVQAVAVTGYTHLPGNDFWNGHAWVAVQLENEWFLCDPTWDAGYSSYSYFLVKPNEFIQSHIPFDPLWQLLEHPIKHKDFKKRIFNAGKNDPVFNYKDSVMAYLQSDTLQQMQSAGRRRQAAGIDNNNRQIWYTYNQMKVNIVLQEENMQLFNYAVTELNKAKKIYNELVEYRNNNFIPPQKSAETESMFLAIDASTNAALKILDDIGKKVENYQYDTDGLKENLLSLIAKTNEKKEYFRNNFLKRK
jgi:hypothetical protein